LYLHKGGGIGRSVVEHECSGNTGDKLCEGHHFYH